ncbi:MTH1187 family thiamine-binding protein [Halotalea alkalilenta]|uniref:MTH1187 family thiamine-binding protein n=1 Tax=Halotalea alkalilenta TaxID=376489 RepID=UPI000488550A|nr:MTH1187 family thiamine-binding protein [Halotalea alkalilenta]
MKVIVDLCVVPLGVGVSVSPHVAACQRVLEEAGLEHRMHAYGTNVEGEWDEVFGAIKRCHQVVHEMGAPRITTTLKLGTRTDREQSMDDKVESVRRRLES